MLCPICKREVPDPAANEPGGFFPFCSERCKLIDLGRWLGGKYQVPVVDPDAAHDGIVDTDAPQGDQRDQRDQRRR